MKDQDLPLVRAITVRVECPHCKGKCSIPGGQRKYGELVKCPACEGLGTVQDFVTPEQFLKILRPYQS